MSTLAGTGKLVRLVLRRDRLLMPLWVLFLALLPTSYAAAFIAGYPTAADRAQYAAVSGDNPSFLLLYGPLYGSSVGALTSWRYGFVPVMIGLVSLLTVIRHTRTEEDAGRRELLGSTVVGRHAQLAAALIATFGANLVLALVLALGLTGQDLPFGESLVFGLAVAMAGWMFAAVGGVAAQLTEGAGAARGIAIGVLGVAFLLRGAGDAAGTTWVSWLSPIGWVHRVNPYGGARWWIFALAFGFVVVLGSAAFALSARRDVGAGVLPPRLGPAYASRALRSPFGLAWRLQRGTLAGWVVGFAAIGAVLGAVTDGVIQLLNDSPQLKDLFERVGGTTSIVDTFLAGIISLLALAASAYAIQAALRLRTEETSTRAEPVLATSVGRLRWVGSHLVFAMLGPALALVVAGVAAGLTYGSSSGDVGRQVGRVLAGALVQMPAVWVLTGLAVALFGLLPRLAAAVGWGVFAVFFVIAQVGQLLKWDQRVLDISPFTHVPRIPGADLAVAPLAWLGLLAAALTVAGLAGFRRRDVPVP